MFGYSEETSSSYPFLSVNCRNLTTAIFPVDTQRIGGISSHDVRIASVVNREPTHYFGRAYAVYSVSVLTIEDFQYYRLKVWLLIDIVSAHLHSIPSKERSLFHIGGSSPRAAL